MSIESWSENILIAELQDDPGFADDVNTLIDQVETRKDVDVVLNFGSVSYVNSSNLAKLLKLRKQLVRVPETIPQAAEAVDNPYLISNLEARLVELQLEEKKLLAKYTPESRLVQNVKEEIMMVNSKLGEQEDKKYESTN